MIRNQFGGFQKEPEISTKIRKQQLLEMEKKALHNDLLMASKTEHHAIFRYTQNEIFLNCAEAK